MGDDDKFPSQLAERFQVACPNGMRDRIAAAAKANGRSMNAEIVATLEEKYPPPITALDAGILKHFRETVAYYSTGDEKKDKIIPGIVLNAYLSLMERVSDMPEEDIKFGAGLEDFHRRIREAIDAQGLRKKP